MHIFITDRQKDRLYSMLSCNLKKKREWTAFIQVKIIIEQALLQCYSNKSNFKGQIK